MCWGNLYMYWDVEVSPKTIETLMYDMRYHGCSQHTNGESSSMVCPGAVHKMDDLPETHLLGAGV